MAETLEAFLQRVREQVDTHLAHYAQEYHQPESLYRPAWEFILAGGKRLRPAITMLAARSAGREAAGLVPGVAVELLHNFTLIHDDIMDHSEQRRGVPTVVARYGVNQAILTGDVLMILAFEILKEAQCPQTTLMTLLAEGARKVCEGQQYDVDATLQTQPDKETYLRIIAHKTAALLETAARMGVVAAGGSNELAHALGQAMHNAGMAFQIVDDWIDLVSDQTGKPAGQDLREEKLTAIEVVVAEAGLWEIWRHHVQEWIKGQKSLQELRSWLYAHGIDQQIQQWWQSYVYQALQFVEQAALPSEERELWKQLIGRLVQRQT